MKRREEKFQAEKRVGVDFMSFREITSILKKIKIIMTTTAMKSQAWKTSVIFHIKF